MKIENIRDVKTNLNKIVGRLPEEGSVIIVALSQNKRFWRVYDEAARRAGEEGWTELDDL